jgi:chaperonin cofactor prefoldin
MIERLKRPTMTQLDLFDETLSKKIHRLEKWIFRLQKEMQWLKEIHNMSQDRKPLKERDKAHQIDFFAG